jgi:hypothetical protein
MVWGLLFAMILMKSSFIKTLKADKKKIERQKSIKMMDFGKKVTDEPNVMFSIKSANNINKLAVDIA